LAEQRLGERALSLFDGSALGVTPSRTASRAASTGAWGTPARSAGRARGWARGGDRSPRASSATSR